MLVIIGKKPIDQQQMTYIYIYETIALYKTSFLRTNGQLPAAISCKKVGGYTLEDISGLFQRMSST